MCSQCVPNASSYHCPPDQPSCLGKICQTKQASMSFNCNGRGVTTLKSSECSADTITLSELAGYEFGCQDNEIRVNVPLEYQCPGRLLLQSGGDKRDCYCIESTDAVTAKFPTLTFTC